MYKLVKWAYERGVQHERERIRRLIITFSRNVEAEKQQYEYMVNNIDPMTKKPSDEQLRINQQVLDVLNKLTEEQYERMVTRTPLDEDVK